MTNYQTIRLSRGQHGSAAEGACVMELASMLADEPFSDHPRSACPVIGALLRAYNDRVDDARRQDLYRYAADVVGTRSPGGVESARADRLQAWSLDMWGRRPTRRWLPGAWRWTGIERRPPRELLGVYAVQAIWRVDDRMHAAVLALVDELLSIRGAADRATGGVRRADERHPQRMMRGRA